ncbi:phosphate-regulating neutral endopeptidase PHEX-like [Rhipicephalus microplus]|uniref:phosphate-regulating neutral endopeptidase PHEX-like n=1 Tax=Rhipicephalus microplus TaxID=6941 RepID=UPI003F6CF95E
MSTVPRASFPDVFYDAPSQSRRNRACTSTACVEYARRLLRQINTSRDPCDDFYAYVCEDWVRARPLPLGSERLSVDTALVDGYAELLASGLRDNATSRFPPLRFLIDNCLRPQPNLFHALRAMFMDAAWLRPWMAQSSARRRPSPVEVSRKLGVAYRELGVDALFRPFVVKEVSSNDTRRFVGLGEPSTVLLRGPLERREYELVRVSFAPLLGFFQNQTDADLLQFEERLALMLGRPQLDAAALVNASMVKVFDLPSLRNIEWTSFLQSVFGKGLRPITARTYVKLASPDYFLRLARGDLLRFSSVLLGYLLFRITMALSPFIWKRELRDQLASVAYARHPEFARALPQSHYCLRLLNRFEPNLPLHVSRRLAESLLGGENAVEDLVSTLRLVLLESVQAQLGPLNSELRAHLRDKLNAVSWEPLSPRAMDSESTRAEYVDGIYLSNSRLSTAQFVYTWIRKSLEKKLLAHMSTRAAAAGGVAAYPGWTGGFLSAESQLPPPYERLEIPLPVFDFFLNEDPSLRPLQMARAGTRVYRPLLRAVYHWAYNFECGSNAYGAETALSRRMNDLRRCLKRQYSTLSWTEQRPQLDASRTSWSDLWDSLALRLALDAFLLDSGRVAPDYRLALLEHWNASQLFFVSYAANMCENGNQRFLRKMAAQGPHSPAWFRVNGPLRNSLEFARAFGCKEPSMPVSGPGQGSPWSASHPAESVPLVCFLKNGVSSLPVALVPADGGAIRLSETEVFQELRNISGHFLDISEVLIEMCELRWGTCRIKLSVLEDPILCLWSWRVQVAVKAENTAISPDLSSSSSHRSGLESTASA